nr:hypothetical protein 14 [Desulfobulbaceae bacterium]
MKKTILALALIVMPLAAQATPVCKSELYADEQLTEATKSIHISERLYLLVKCKGLPIGENHISTQWMDEQGSLRVERTHTLDVKDEQVYGVAFKFKQMMNGTITSMSSGSEYDDNQYGEWAVLSFINSNQIAKDTFTIND